MIIYKTTYRILSALTTMILIAMGFSSIQAKRWQPVIIAQDSARMEIIYVHVTIDPKDGLDNNGNPKQKTDFEVLAIGDSLRWYGGEGGFQLDSIAFEDPDWKDYPTREDYRKIRREMEPINVYMMTNLNNSIVYYYGKIFINYYRYEEPIPSINWKLEDETMRIMGYDCRKATARWRGRDWTAWYSDIPISAGPWKFNGLPGLILRLEDSKKEHYFEAVETKNYVCPIGKRQSLFCKTNREKYNMELRDYKENAGAMFLDSGMVKRTEGDAEKMRKVRLFFNPIELE